MGSIPVAGAMNKGERICVPLYSWHLLRKRTSPRKRREAGSGSHTPPEDRQARLSGAGRGYSRVGEIPVDIIKRERIGAPTVKQFYIKIQKGRGFLVLFAHDLACKV